MSRSSKRPIPRILVIALAAAASLAGVALWISSKPLGNGSAAINEAPTLGGATEVSLDSVNESSLAPTIWAYHQVLREDSESLGDVLDAHATRLGNADPESLRMGISLYNDGVSTES